MRTKMIFTRKRITKIEVKQKKKFKKRLNENYI